MDDGASFGAAPGKGGPRHDAELSPGGEPLAPAEGSPLLRAARTDDIGHLVRLYTCASDELQGMRGGAVLLGLGGRPGDLAGSFSRQLTEPNCLVLLAFPQSPDGEPAGYGTCAVHTLAGGELLGSIEELYVKPDERRRGLGRTMAESLVGWCRAKGCTSVDAKALPGSRAVKSFFEGEGFTARLLVMHRKLC